MVSAILTDISRWLPTAGPTALAFMVAWGGSWGSRRWSRLPAIWAATGAGVGWAWLSGASWQLMARPRSMLAALVVPALAFAFADLLRVRSRWIGVAAVCFAAWWLADAPLGRPQFWRVSFGGVLAAWLLRLLGASEPRLAMGAALTALFGLLLGGAATNWDWAMAILAMGAAGVWVGSRNGVVPVGLTMVGLLGADLSGGRVMRGGVSIVDMACLAAIGAPLLIPRLERRLRRRLGGVAAAVAVFVVAVGLAGVAWVVSRALRR